MIGTGLIRHRTRSQDEGSGSITPIVPERHGPRLSRTLPTIAPGQARSRASRTRSALSGTRAS